MLVGMLWDVAAEKACGPAWGGCAAMSLLPELGKTPFEGAESISQDPDECWILSNCQKSIVQLELISRHLDIWTA